MKKTKKIVGLLILAIAVILAIPTASKANVQSRPNAIVQGLKTASEFFLLCRQMETETGPMGLNATIAVQSNKVVETSTANNIDVHMIKNTEYGAVAMLAVSSYGSCPKGYYSTYYEELNDSTTGNASGVMKMAAGKHEYVAGIWTGDNYTGGSKSKYLYNADDWHVNRYDSQTAKAGDATLETPKWKGASNAGFVKSGYHMFSRSGYGIFNIGGGSYNSNKGYDGAYDEKGSRAAIVSGIGY